MPPLDQISRPEESVGKGVVAEGVGVPATKSEVPGFVNKQEKPKPWNTQEPAQEGGPEFRPAPRSWDSLLLRTGVSRKTLSLPDAQALLCSWLPWQAGEQRRG